ncbi:hypothetical protein [Herbaspirillum huttiense]|uniref:Uncharacterized protein n=1 Tax=Herbaspirillum huttiense subsp. lycopersici TaxID=3074428 RepID=A0ABU2EG63_9BURK|nr:hypothetical protein [Herbaspirillum huttiense]MDR9847129.1 hypothetical protein [Herbaspirillum huttiense SE1]
MPFSSNVVSEVKSIKKVSLEEVAEYLEASTVLEKLDVGSALIYKLKHKIEGNIVLFNSAFGQSAVVAG